VPLSFKELDNLNFRYVVSLNNLRLLAQENIVVDFSVCSLELIKIEIIVNFEKPVVAIPAIAAFIDL
jgi:hypothetical protein